MIAPTDPRAATRADLGAAAAAGVAEAAVLWLPVHALLTGGGSGAAAFAPLFLAGVAGAVMIACRYRTWPRVSTAIATIAVVAGLIGGRGGGLQREALAAVVFLLIGLRAVMLGFRDWRVPIGASFVVCTIALAVETIVGAAAPHDWGPTLIVLVPLCFVASLASRAVSVWTGEDAADLPRAEREQVLRHALASTAWIPLVMVGAVGLGVRGGVLDRLGSTIAPIGDAFASLLAFVFSQIARPFFWLADRLHVNPNGVRRLLARVGHHATRAQHRAVHRIGHPALGARLVGLAAFVLLVWGLARLMRRIRPEPQSSPMVGPASTATVERRDVEPTVTAPPTRRLRREPPADRVRGWYAEALDALAARGLAKEDAATPAEFAPLVGLAYPECADGFVALTRAYEDVRYGSLHLNRPALRRLEEGQRGLLHAVRRRPPGPG